MDTKIDQTGRPVGHPGYCACAECFEWDKRRQARFAPAKAASAPPQAGPTNAQLYGMVREIRTWVTIIGWIVVVQAILAITFGFMAGLRG